MKKFLLCAVCLFTLIGIGTGCKKHKITGIEVTNHQLVVLKGTELSGLKVNTILMMNQKEILLMLLLV